MKVCELLRPKDINIEVCIGIQPGQEVNFHTFEAPALNTFDEAMALRARQGGARPRGTHKLKTMTMAQCLEKHLPKGQKIDFLSIDIEGVDELVLRSNDWNRFSPKAIIFESHKIDLNSLSKDPLITFLSNLGYKIVGKCGPSFIARHEGHNHGQ